MSNPEEVLAHYQSEWENRVMNMKPGSEMDALVAEKVMGECRHEFEVSGPNAWNHRCKKCGATDSNFSGSNLFTVGTDVPYSTDISAAWEVVEKMGDCLHLRQHGEQGEWEARFCGYPTSKAHGETAPESICKAALLVVGVNGE